MKGRSLIKTTKGTYQKGCLSPSGVRDLKGQEETQKTFRRYEITIEESKEEKDNLQRFLMEAHRLSLTCFSSITSDILNG